MIDFETLKTILAGAVLFALVAGVAAALINKWWD